MVKWHVLGIGACGVLVVGATGLWVMTQNSSATTSSHVSQQTTRTASSSATTAANTDNQSFDKQAHSTTDPESVWVVVNKQHAINPAAYVPSDLRKPAVTLRVPAAAEMQLRSEAATATEQLFNDAHTAGYDLQVSTAYRGYAYQQTLYDAYVKESGQAAADTFSARPSYSEHQTGWALDVRTADNQCPLQTCFGELPAGKWLAANAYRYGFILRYPADKADVTGYSYEPWHFRYVGTELAAEMHQQNITTMEEFFGVSGGVNY